MPLAEEIAAFRRFNRFHTRLVGALNHRLAYAEVSLPEARVIWELANAAQAPAAQELAGALALDPGHLSRVIGGLERRGLLARAADPADRRRRVLTLTAAGRALFRAMDEASSAEAAARLEIGRAHV